MFQRLNRGGWPYSQPPNVAFDPNKDSEQYRGLEAWWPTLASQGTKALRDLIAPPFDLDLQDNAHYVFVPVMGSMIQLDGAGDYVGVGQKILYLGDWSVSLWVRLANLTGNQTLWAQGPAYTSRREVYVTNAGTVRFTVWGGFNWLNSTVNLTAGILYNITATYSHSDTTKTIYINGIQRGTIAVETYTAESDDSRFRLGLRTQGGQDLTGVIGGNAGIWYRALTPTGARGLWAPQTRWELCRPRIRQVLAMYPVEIRIPRPPAAYNILAIY